MLRLKTRHATATLLTMHLVGCSTHAGLTPASDKDSTSSLGQLANGANELVSEAMRDPKLSGSQVLSPAVVLNALAMLAPAASGPAAPADQSEIEREFEALLGGPLANILEAVKLLVDSSEEAQASRAPITTEFKSALFSPHRSGFGLQEHYKRAIEATWGFDPMDTEFRLPELLSDNFDTARETINTWVKNATEKPAAPGKSAKPGIQNLFPAGTLDKATSLVAVSTLDMAGPWATKFPESNTHLANFRNLDGTTVQVPMMQIGGEREGPDKAWNKHFDFTEYYAGYTDGANLRFKALIKDLGKPGESYHPYRMMFLLPDEDTDLATLENVLSAEFLAGVYQDTQTDRDGSKHSVGQLSLPRFELTPASMNLNDTLKKLGAGWLFSAAALGRAFDDAEANRIAQVVQKARIEVNECGVSATAAAGAGVSRSFAMTTFIANRPFLAYITQDIGGSADEPGTPLVLFEARVTDLPNATSVEPAECSPPGGTPTASPRVDSRRPATDELRYHRRPASPFGASGGAVRGG